MTRIRPLRNEHTTWSADRDAPGALSDIHMEYGVLTISIYPYFDDDGEPLREFPLIRFDRFRGFRALPENDLYDLWTPYWKKNPGQGLLCWLWLVEAGGWLEQETARDGYMGPHNSSIEEQEFLIYTEDDCLSVISTETPVLHLNGSDIEISI